METALSVENVSKIFKLKKQHAILEVQPTSYVDDKLVALDKISFEVPKGEMLGIIGLNGSGKTTLLRIIAGIYKPDSGSVHLKGRLGPLLHIGTGFHNELTASENIIISGLLLGIPKPEIKKKVNDIIEFAGLQEFTNMKLKHFSSGMRARLAFSVAIQIDPDILLVDEILSVGDIAFRDKSFNAFLSFKNKGKTIVYTTHNLEILPRICDRVLLLDHGKMIMIGEPVEVIKKYKEMVKPKEGYAETRYDIAPSHEIKINSEPIPIVHTKVYEWKVKIACKKLGEKSAFIAIIFMKNQQEVDRRIRFITDSSGKPNEYSIVSAVPLQADHAVLSYRVNCVGAKPAHTVIELPPIEESTLRAVENSTPEDYDVL